MRVKVEITVDVPEKKDAAYAITPSEVFHEISQFVNDAFFDGWNVVGGSAHEVKPVEANDSKA